MKATFIEPMLLLKTDDLPSDGARWEYSLKLDGFRAVAYKSGGRIELRSRNDKDFTRLYPDIVNGLAGLPDDTIIDGEIVALDDEGRPSFTLLQLHGGGKAPILFFIFDVMVAGGRNLLDEPLSVRRQCLEEQILPTLAEPVRYAAPLDHPLPVLIESVKAHRLEGLIAKRRDSRYEPGQRSGAWRKMRVNQGQEFVIGGYTLGSGTFDALIIGYYEEDEAGDDRHRLIYTARVRSGFTPALRAQVFRKFRGLEIPDCPFVNLPEGKSGPWDVGLTQDKMSQCRWLTPRLVAQVEYVEWTEGNHLRHTRFIGLRDDKPARTVTRERAARMESDAD